jgi:hypothetical protein
MFLLGNAIAHLKISASHLWLTINLGYISLHTIIQLCLSKFSLFELILLILDFKSFYPQKVLHFLFFAINIGFF